MTLDEYSSGDADDGSDGDEDGPEDDGRCGGKEEEEDNDGYFWNWHWHCCPVKLTFIFRQVSEVTA